jgi:hypothetical protein
MFPNAHGIVTTPDGRDNEGMRRVPVIWWHRLARLAVSALLVVVTLYRTHDTLGPGTILFFAIIAAGDVYTWNHAPARSNRPGRRGEARVEPRSVEAQRFIGGLRTLYWPEQGRPLLSSMGSNATRPLAELIVDDECVYLRLRHRWMASLFGSQIPPFESRIDGLRAGAFGRLPVTRGVLLEPATSPRDPSAVFWCSRQRQRQVLELLRTRGAKIDQTG